MLIDILMPVLSLGGMSLLFGAGLAFASQKFAIETDPKEEQIKKALPGINCGACGYPGCDGFAAAVATGQAPITGCTVGGSGVAHDIGLIMGLKRKMPNGKWPRFYVPEIAIGRLTNTITME